MAKNRKGRKNETDITRDELRTLLEDAAEKGARKALEDAEKSADGGGDTAAELVEEIIDEAIDRVDAEKRRKARKEDGAEITIEEIEDIVLDVIDETKRKSRKEDPSDEEQKSLDALDEDDVLESIVAAVSDEALIEDEEKSACNDDEEKESGSADDEDKHKSRKSYSSGKSRKTRRFAENTKNKYSDIYLRKSGGNMNKEQKKIPPDVQLARAVKCFDVFGRHDPEAAAYYAKARYNDDNMAREFKALTATVPSGGGFLIPEVYVDQVIELLYPKTVMFELGAQKVPMPSGNLNLPKMTAGVRATWSGEKRKIAKSQPEFGNIRMSAKRLSTIVPTSRELLMLSSFSADQIFANDLTRKMQLGLDYGGLMGKGGDSEPTGIANNKDVDKIDVSTITDTSLVTGGKITADFPVYLRSTLLQKNVDDQAIGWAFNSVLEGVFMNMKTTTGAYIYREEMNAKKLLGFPYKVSNQIALDGNKTSLFLGNWNDLLIGETAGLETYTTLDGAWIDEDGTQHSAFDENLAATRAMLYCDIALRHSESFLYVHKIGV